MDFQGAKKAVDKALELDAKYVKAWARKGDIEILQKVAAAAGEGEGTAVAAGARERRRRRRERVRVCGFSSWVCEFWRCMGGGWGEGKESKVLLYFIKCL